MEELKINNNIASEDLMENPPDPGRVIEGLRDTGYDFNTAIADIVDNSIAAGASRVDILINVDPQMQVSVYIADNGCGMDAEGLKNAMRYGSDRRANAKSLGKFGLGLKTASTAFCKKLSLVSRGEDGEARKVQWDLDFVAYNGWMLRKLTPSEDEMDILDETTGGGTGTVVVWEEIDRLFLKQYRSIQAAKKAVDKQVTLLSKHLALTYQRFLDPSFKDVPQIIITLNGTAIKPRDPFCLKEPNTDKLSEMPINITLPDGTTAPITLKAYAIPSKNMFSSPEAETEAAVSVNTMGFYVYRENRLIHYGDLLGMYTKDPHDSLLRVDFSFDYRFDEAFNIDIKKSRVLLNEEVYRFIQDNFLRAPKKVANQKYRAGTAQIVSKGGEGAHDASNQNIEKQAPQLEGAKVTVTNADTGEVQIQNKNGTFTHTIRVQASESPTTCRVEPVKSLESGFLWEPAIIDGKHAVLINKSHPYYQKIYYPVLAQTNLVTGMDALLWALAESELSTYKEENDDTYEDIRYQVSKALKKLVADLPDPEPDGENE